MKYSMFSYFFLTVSQDFSSEHVGEMMCHRTLDTGVTINGNHLLESSANNLQPNMVEDCETSSVSSCKSDVSKTKKGFIKRFHRLLRRIFYSST